MTSVNLKLYNIARNKFKLSELDAKEFVEAIKEVIKEDALHLQNESKSIFKDDFHRIELKIEQSKTDTLKWIFGCFITLALMILGIYLKK